MTDEDKGRDNNRRRQGVKNGKCGQQTGTLPTICRRRRGGGGEHPCPMDGCRQGGDRETDKLAHRDGRHYGQFLAT